MSTCGHKDNQKKCRYPFYGVCAGKQEGEACEYWTSDELNDNEYGKYGYRFTLEKGKCEGATSKDRACRDAVTADSVVYSVRSSATTATAVSGVPLAAMLLAAANS